MKLPKKIALLLGALIITSTCVYGSITLANPAKQLLPTAIESNSPCPVAGCSAAQCHTNLAPPSIDELEAGQTLICPKMGCADAGCHSYDRLTGHYLQPKAESVNVWIIGIAAFTIVISFIIKKA